MQVLRVSKLDTFSPQISQLKSIIFRAHAMKSYYKEESVCLIVNWRENDYSTKDDVGRLLAVPRVILPFFSAINL